MQIEPQYVLVPVVPTDAMLEAVIPFPEHLFADGKRSADDRKSMEVAALVDRAAFTSQYRKAILAAHRHASPDPVIAELNRMADYLDGYAGGHHMAKACATLLRERAESLAGSSAAADDSAVERVAIALHQHDHPDATMPWGQFSGEWKEVYRQKARAAIAALGDSGSASAKGT